MKDFCTDCRLKTHTRVRMEIVQIAVECAPLVKVGGLADVVLGLSRALHGASQSVEIVLPKYDCLDLTSIKNLEIHARDLICFYDQKTYPLTIWKGTVYGVLVTLIETHDPYGFFERKTVYGDPDDQERFCFFTRAAFDYLAQREKKPDIIHLHDWHTAIGAPLKKFLFPDLQNTSVILTIHNLAYQGICDKRIIKAVGLDASSLDQPDLLQDHSYPHCFNLLQGGIVFADQITTVSPTYAKEVLTEKNDHGLGSFLSTYHKKFTGILNGIDVDIWSPETDPLLPVHYSLGDLKATPPFILQKAKLKKILQHQLALDETPSFLAASITRLTTQKAPELIKMALLHVKEKGGSFVLLGTPSDHKTHDEFAQLKNTLASNKKIHIELTYNEPLAHLVYAAADLFIVPSLYEPCGLTQMIAMNYGTVPLVRETGGLADTVHKGKNGFSFGPATKKGLCFALDAAMTDYHSNPTIWHLLIKNGMSNDFSWRIPAQQYLKLYQSTRKLALDV